METCQRCKKLPVKFKIKNKEVVLNICDCCEEKGDELIEDNREKPKDEFTYGRLHFVKKTLKDFECRVCKQEIPSGSSCYSQSQKKEGMPFPFSTRVCESCSKELIKGGTVVA